MFRECALIFIMYYDGFAMSFKYVEITALSIEGQIHSKILSFGAINMLSMILCIKETQSLSMCNVE